MTPTAAAGWRDLLRISPTVRRFGREGVGEIYPRPMRSMSATLASLIRGRPCGSPAPRSAW